MRIAELPALYEADYHVYEVFSMRQFWREGAVFRMRSPRKTSALLYLCGCRADYQIGKRTLWAPKGSLVYIPSGSTYTTQFSQCRGCAAILIEFILKDEDQTPFDLFGEVNTVSQNADPVIRGLFEAAADVSERPVRSPAKLRSLIYEILTHLAAAERENMLASGKFASIARGITLMDSNKSFGMSVGEIARVCGVSPSTFRRLFKEWSGKSPAGYLLKARIDHAARLLSIGTLSAAQTSAACGFRDPAYFSRIFKKYTGTTPGEYGKPKRKTTS
ncbi:MAG: helix-turn-helix transcriptional regulator [Clostridia bacterium]|nr:helix-turn-helix transcriptional regulator [Clostridia bacterium]